MYIGLLFIESMWWFEFQFIRYEPMPSFIVLVAMHSDGSEFHDKLNVIM